MSLNAAHYIPCHVLLTIPLSGREFSKPINLNHKHGACTVQSRPEAMYLFPQIWKYVCMHFTRHDQSKTPLSPPPSRGRLITLKGQNGHHNEADRIALAAALQSPKTAVKTLILFLPVWNTDVPNTVIYYSWIRLIDTLTCLRKKRIMSSQLSPTFNLTIFTQILLKK